MPNAIRTMAGFLQIPMSETGWPAIQGHFSFAWIKKNATRSVPLAGAFWDAGAEVFIHKGVNGRWFRTLTEQHCRHYQQRAAQEVGNECAPGLAEGT